MPEIDRGDAKSGCRIERRCSNISIVSVTVIIVIVFSLSFVFLPKTPIWNTVPPSEDKLASISYTVREPIWINNDAAFTKENGVVSGSGTSTDPYIIEGWEIRDSYIAIDILYTTKYFIIRNCLIDSNDYGIVFYELRNGKAINNICTDSRVEGIHIERSVFCTISDNDLTCSGSSAIRVCRNSMAITITNNDCRWVDQYAWPNAASILVDNSTLIRISNNSCINDYSISNNRVYGIKIVNSLSATVSNNNCQGNTYGIYQDKGNRTNLAGNNCSLSIYGIVAVHSNNVSITRNICHDTNDNGIFVWGVRDTTVSNNTVASAGCHGILMQYSSYCVISNNTCRQNSESCISCDHTHNSSIMGNSCLGGIMTNIWVWESRNINIECNNCSFGSLYGLLVEYAQFINITHNYCSFNSNNSGIALYLVNYAVISENRCCFNNYGINLYATDNSEVRSNDVSHNSCDGLILCGSNLVIYDNQFAFNLRYGIRIWIDGGIIPSQNQIYMNAFIGNNGASNQYDSNHVQACDDGQENLWYKPIDDIGNYWSDWTTPDYVPPWGIVDQPYDVDGSAKESIDYYPLTYNPLVWIPEPSVLTLIVSMILIFLTIQKSKGRAKRFSRTE